MRPYRALLPTWLALLALWERDESGGRLTSAAVAMPDLGSVFTTDVALEGEALRLLNMPPKQIEHAYDAATTALARG